MAQQNTNPEALADRVEEDLRITEEERRGSIPGSTQATVMCHFMRTAQANPVVERGPPRKVKKSKSKSVSEKSTQTEKSVLQKKQ